jgi:transcriptional regulator with XRE-family HTH domain
VPAAPNEQPQADPEHLKSRVLTSVIAENIRDRRTLGRFSQEALAARMRQLGHAWSRSTVGDVEREQRIVAVKELVALAIVLQVDLGDLLDPTGVDGSRTAPLSYGDPDDLDRMIPAVVAHHWLRGTVHLSFPRGPGSPWIEGVEGRRADYEECERALREWSSERARRGAAENIANEEKKEQQ